MLRNLFLVMAGGALGSALRFLVTFITNSDKFPYATLLVNIVGSFIIGMLLALGLKNNQQHAGLWLFLATGLCGGFTTFSTFSMDNLHLLQTGKPGLAIINVLVSVVVGIFACFAGYKIFA